MLVALLLRLCGVAVEEVCQEYALSEFGLEVWRKEAVARLVRGELGGDEEGARRMLGCKAEYMRAFLEEVVELQEGGVQMWAEKGLGWSSGDIERLRRNVIAAVVDM